MSTDKKETNTDTDKKSTLTLGAKGTLGLKNPSVLKARGTGSSSSKSVTVEVKRKRSSGPAIQGFGSPAPDAALSNLTEHERNARLKALEAAQKQAEIDEQRKAEEAARKAEEAEFLKNNPHLAKKAEEEKPAKKLTQRERELEELRKIQELEKVQEIELSEEKQKQVDDFKNKAFRAPTKKELDDIELEKQNKKRVPTKDGETSFGGGKLTVQQAMNYEYEVEQRQRSLASQRRARQKDKRKLVVEETVKQVRKIVVPEAITVQELAKRMAEKVSDVIKALMKMDVMATQNQSIDADTAELIISEFGHEIQRVTEADVEQSIDTDVDSDADLLPRAPVVTIMGHVDHGKTSILDALRQTDVVAGEAGGITQHIGAYQITMENGNKITFLDTPGHAAFSEMRARGANVTDIVVLVVAANDSIMPQTIEAIRHAKAAGVPIVVAINKCDLPTANPQKVKEDLLQHEIVVEDYSGDVQAVEVSAKAKIGLDKLEEAILLQAEILELRANPNRSGRGSVVEAKLDKGRGSVATVLVQNGTIRVGDIFVCGGEWGKIRSLVNDKGQQIKEAGPALPVEVIGLSNTPQAGDDFAVVKTEQEAREISEYRQRKSKEISSAAGARTIDQLFAQAKDTSKKQLAVIIKADVHGSVEAIAGSLKKLSETNEEVDIRVLHSGVGEITEADVTLSNASNAVIIGFNVRANTQAREKAKKDNREIRYYSIIYNVIDDMRALIGGLLSPVIKEEFIGYAQIRQVFSVTKVGKVAGCMVTDGQVKRGAKVRLLRDNVVVHEGTLKTLQRFKDEVKEVREGMECGMAFDNYDDIKEGDMIECFEVTSHARTF